MPPVAIKNCNKPACKPGRGDKSLPDDRFYRQGGGLIRFKYNQTASPDPGCKSTGN